MNGTEVILRLFFYGLVAFTPDKLQCNGNMRALLIDAREPPVASDGCPIHSHAPALFYSVTKPESCRHPCRFDRGLCRCDLDGGHLLDIGRTEDDLCYEQQDCNPNQGTSGACWGEDFDFIPKLKRMRPFRWRMTLREDCDKPCPVKSDYCPGGMCKLIAAQVNFHPESFYVCRLAGPPQGTTGHASAAIAQPSPAPEFDFKPLGSTNLWWPFRRQIAEIVHSEVKIMIKRDEIELRIAAFDGGGSYAIHVPVFESGGKYYADLVVGNFMEEVDHSSSYARCHQNNVARDFELYHDLARQPMQPADRAIPRADEDAKPKPPPSSMKNYTYCSNSEALGIFLVDILRAGDSRPICPQAAVRQ